MVELQRREGGLKDFHCIAKNAALFVDICYKISFGHLVNNNRVIDIEQG